MRANASGTGSPTPTLLREIPKFSLHTSVSFPAWSRTLILALNRALDRLDARSSERLRLAYRIAPPAATSTV
jgi:hypothetical protein